MKEILKYIDNILCKYIGLYKQEVTPEIFKKKGNKMMLINTESFKRHIYCEKWEDFLSVDFKKMSGCTKEKIGISMGKSLGKNLVISFENVLIKKEAKNV